MSDTPMRLKYLTKMKVILCIFLLYITAVIVFGESQELNGVVGKSIEFPAAVKIDGSLRYSSVPIGDVTSSRFTAPHSEKFNGRVQRDSSTGLFSLSGLKMEDSGEYTVQDTQQNINTVFQLNVYKGNVPVLKPHLNVTRNEYRCTVLCAAARGTGATLTLYREGETNPYVTSPGHSHPDLNVTQTVESGTYTCEAKNSVSRETSDPLTVGAHCTGSSAGTIAAIIIAVVAVAIVALIAVVFVFLYRRSKTEIRDEQVALQDAVKTSIQDTKSKLKDEQAVLLKAVETLIQDEQAVLRDALNTLFQGSKTEIQALKRSIQDEQAALQDAVKTEIRGSKTEIQALKRSIKDEQAALQDAVKTEIRGSKTEIQALKTSIQALNTSIQDEQVALRDAVKTEIRALKTSIQDEEVALRDAVKTEIRALKRSIQGSKTEIQGSKTEIQGMMNREEKKEIPPPQLTPTYHSQAHSPRLPDDL